MGCFFLLVGVTLRGGYSRGFPVKKAMVCQSHVTALWGDVALLFSGY